jgi:predicted TIM-barrel fold metal-dependent hydrolase
VQLLGDRRIVYASDYYHWDCRFPDSARLIADRGDLGHDTKQRILADNARDLYGL